MSRRGVEMRAPTIAPARPAAMPVVCPGCGLNALEGDSATVLRWRCPDPRCRFANGWTLEPAATLPELDEVDGPNTVYAIPLVAPPGCARLDGAAPWPYRQESSQAAAASAP